MILSEWCCDEEWRIRDWQRWEEEERSAAKSKAEMLAAMNGTRISSWIRVKNPVVGKCSCCGTVGIVKDPEIGLFSG